MQNKLHIAILGTRGIPNNYGGFEQFAENLATGLVKRGFSVTVYNPHFHPIRQREFNGVHIIPKWHPERYFGAAANFVYDYLCLKDALDRGFEIIYELGYQSAAISYYFCNIDRAIVITNMDGLEWKRAKWNRLVQKITKWFEMIGVRKSAYIVADNIGIQHYITTTYGKSSFYIPYGAKLFENPNATMLKPYNLYPFGYYLIIARLEPENNVDMILEGFSAATTQDVCIVIGDRSSKHGKRLYSKFAHDSRIRFIGALYNQEHLDNLRYFSKLYFHGHSVGGTNPSLLEAMAAGAFICSHNNPFNRSVLGSDALFFSSKNDIADQIGDYGNLQLRRPDVIKNNFEKIVNKYAWDTIISQYEDFFNRALHEHRHSYTK